MFESYGNADPYRNTWMGKKNDSSNWLGGSSSVGNWNANPLADRKLQDQYGVPMYKRTTGLPSRLSFKDGQWTNSTLLGTNPSGGAFYHQKMPYGWNPLKTGVPWSQTKSIGSDASRQGAYLGGITYNAPQINYMGTYQDKALTDRPYLGGRRGMNQTYRRLPSFL